MFRVQDGTWLQGKMPEGSGAFWGTGFQRVPLRLQSQVPEDSGMVSSQVQVRGTGVLRKK